MATKPRYYFGYGSNMHRDQMRRRCPTSAYYGRAFLPDWKFIILDRGYASIDRCTNPDLQIGNDKVWGSVYTLEPEDEEKLDVCEEVNIPIPSYTKEEMECTICPPGAEDDSSRWEKLSCLVYVATTQTTGTISDEYIIRMSKAIADSEAPRKYIVNFLQPWLLK